MEPSAQLECTPAASGLPRRGEGTGGDTPVGPSGLPGWAGVWRPPGPLPQEHLDRAQGPGGSRESTGGLLRGHCGGAGGSPAGCGLGQGCRDFSQFRGLEAQGQGTGSGFLVKAIFLACDGHLFAVSSCETLGSPYKDIDPITGPHMQPHPSPIPPPALPPDTTTQGSGLQHRDWGNNSVPGIFAKVAARQTCGSHPNDSAKQRAVTCRTAGGTGARTTHARPSRGVRVPGIPATWGVGRHRAPSGAARLCRPDFLSPPCRHVHPEAARAICLWRAQPRSWGRTAGLELGRSVCLWWPLAEVVVPLSPLQLWVDRKALGEGPASRPADPGLGDRAGCGGRP